MLQYIHNQLHYIRCTSGVGPGRALSPLLGVLLKAPRYDIPATTCLQGVQECAVSIAVGKLSAREARAVVLVYIYI